ncbi:MAG: hypothetical protein HPY71_16070 [Firmicutes bacterium]|nr:hypothetical protein [Bacillota bacterium]
MRDRLSVLAVGAHPDDLELLCGGTLAKYAKLGHEVTMCHVLNGDLGHFHIPRKELAATRAREAEEAGKLIGARVVNLDISDLGIYPTEEIKLKVMDVIRLAKPDVIITHPPNDYMPDHTIASQVVFDASFMASLPQLESEHEFHPKVTPIYYMDSLAGCDFLPTDYVDVTDTMELKRQMLARHESQVTWMKEHDHIDFLDFMETQAKFRGYQCGVKYAEGFRKCETYLRNLPMRMLP